jgi:hypothetical protein
MDNPLFLRKEQALTEWVLVLQMKERNVLMISIDCWGVRLVCNLPRQEEALILSVTGIIAFE